MTTAGGAANFLPNLLVISDLHLGDDLRPAGREKVLQSASQLEHEVIAFLDYYSDNRQFMELSRSEKLGRKY